MNWSKRDWFFCLILAVITLLAYQPVWHGGLLWDDDANIGGPELRTLDGLRRMWFIPRTTQQYYPLLHTSYWLQQRLWGDSNAGYHLVNLFLHVACVVLVLKILRFLRIPGAELAAIIFALHPVNVETVAWITERKNTLSGLFGLGATLAYLRFDQKRELELLSRDSSTPLHSARNDGTSRGGQRKQGHGYSNYLFAIGLFVLGLLSKTAIVTLPLAWLVILWWKRATISWRRDVIPLMPFFFLSAAAGVMTRWVEYGNIGYKASTTMAFSLIDRCLIAGRAFWFQLSKVLWPSDLMFVYPRWDINAGEWWQYLFPLAVFALLGILWSLRRWSRAPLAGVLVYSLLLLPTLGFLNQYFFIYSFVSDHWQYLACLGIITPCASGMVLLAGRFKRWRAWLEPALTLVIGGVLFVITSRQSRTYTDIETLYRTAIARNPACWMAQVNLGNILYKANRIPEAMDLFQQASEIKPAIAHYSLGNALIDKGRTSEAIEEYRHALRIDADYLEAHNNLGNALLLTGHVSEAIDEYAQALRIDRNNAQAHSNLGNALVQAGRSSEAIEHYYEALRMNPESALIRSNLGTALAQVGRIPEAIEQMKTALRINPGDAEARNNLEKLEAARNNAPPKVDQKR